MMMIRWTQEAGADMRSVFLCNTNTADATTEDLVALQKKNPFKEQVFRSTMWSTYNAGRKNSIPSGVHKPLANLSRSRMKASPLPLTVPMMIITK